MKGIAHLERLALLGESGRYWYVHAYAQIESASTLLRCEPDRLADLLSIFSPRVSVLRSIRHTLFYIQAGKYRTDVRRGIRTGVEHYNLTGEIRGPKTHPFAQALKGDTGAIVLDVWICRALGIDQLAVSKRDTRRIAKARIRAVARRLGWQPSEAQAAIWAGTLIQAGRNVPRLHLVDATLWGSTLRT